MPRGPGFACLVLIALVASLAAAPGALAAPPANDAFASAQPLSPASGTPASASGTTVEATKEPGEPVHAANAGGRSVWFTWTASASRRVRVSACGSAINTLLSAYTGSSVGSLGLVAENDDNSSCANGTRSSVELNVSANQTYRIAVDGKNAAQGSVSIAVSDVGPRSPDNDDFLAAGATSPASGVPAAVAAGSTSGATAEPGEPAHDGRATRSVWYRWTATQSETIQASTCGSPSDARIAVYQGTSVFALTRVTAERTTCPTGLGRRLTLAVAAGQTYRIAIDSPTGAGSFVLALAKPPPVLSIADVAVEEGDVGRTGVAFTVALSRAIDLPVSVAYATTTFPGYPTEQFFEPAQGTITIPAGETAGRFTVQVIADIAEEADERIDVELSGIANATLGDSRATATILNDDGPPPEGWDCNSFYCLAPGLGPVRMSRSDQPSELVRTVPITRRGRARTVMVVGPGRLGEIAAGERVVASGEVEVSVTCLEQMRKCVGSRYRYSPRVSGRLVLRGAGGAERKGGAIGLSRRRGLTCSQELPHRNHHCVLVFPPSGERISRACDSCRVTLELAASHRNAGRGDKLVIGSDSDGGIAQDRGHLNAIVVGPEAEDPVRTASRDRSRRALPVGGRASSGSKRVVYSHRLDDFEAHEQVFVDARALVRTRHLSYGTFIGAELVLADGPAGVKPQNGAVESALVTEKNGFNCTRGRSAHDNPCEVRKVGFFRAKRDADKPVFVNLVVQAAARFGGRWRSSDRAKVLRGGGIVTDRYGPLGWARLALPP